MFNSSKRLVSIFLLFCVFSASATAEGRDINGKGLETVFSGAVGASVAVSILSPATLFIGAIGSASVDYSHKSPAEKATVMEDFLKEDNAVILTHSIPLENGQRYVLQRPSDNQTVMFDLTDKNATERFAKVPLNTLITVEKESYGIILLDDQVVLGLFPNELGEKLANPS